MDREKIAYHIREILKEIGENPDREGLIETPIRVARMYEEIFRGIGYTNAEIAEKYAKTFNEEEDLFDANGNYVIVKNIPIFSYCEHHLALMYNMKVGVAYIPRKKIIGLSKIPRIVDMVCKRLQLQEKIGNDIADILEMILGTKDIMVVIKGEHSCVTTRGIRKPGTVTTTTCLRGVFKKNENLRKEFLLQIK